MLLSRITKFINLKLFIKKNSFFQVNSKFKVKYFLILLLFFFLLFFLFFYIYYLIRFPKPHDRSYFSQYYPEDIMLKTGSRLSSPKNRLQHFLNFSPLKEKDVIRVGVFGCSYTWSKQVDKTASYPHQLQNMLNNYFPNKTIEVLNFGVNGAGFHEQFFLWEKYARDYDLDYILLGPRTFHPFRESTFRETEGFEYFEYPADRFILSKDNQLKRVHIKGNTLEERYKNYYSLVPSYIALRYDRSPFQVWEFFSPRLRYKTFNPFYYKKISIDEEKSIVKELAKINTLLLEKIQKLHPKKVLVVLDTSSGFEHFDKINYYSSYISNKNNFNYNNYPYERETLYRSFTHYSSLGYEITAKFFFNALIGENFFFLNVLKCYFENKLFKSNVSDINLSQLDSIKITGNQVSLIKFVLIDSYYKKSSNYHLNQKIQSFIGFSSTESSSFGNVIYLPIPFQLKEGMKVYIQLSNKEKIELGAIQPLDSHGKFFNFFGEYIENFPSYFDNYNSAYGSYFISNEMSSLIKDKLEKLSLNNLPKVFIGDYKLGVLKPYTVIDGMVSRSGKILKLIPYNGEYSKSFLMMGPSHFVQEKNLPVEFTLHIKYTMNNGKTFESLIPNWKCKKEKKEIHLNFPNFKPLK